MMSNRITGIVTAGVLVFVIASYVQSRLVHDVQPGAAQQAWQTPNSTTQISSMPKTTLLL